MVSRTLPQSPLGFHRVLALALGSLWSSLPRAALFLVCGNSSTTPRSRKLFPKSGATKIQETADHVLQSNDHKFKLNLLKYKELRIDFQRKPNEVTVIEACGNSFETIKSAKVLGVTLRGDLKWNDYVDNITVKASQRIYLLEHFKRAGIDRISLIHFYCACILSVLEYAFQAFHSYLPVYFSNQIERVQKRVLRIIYLEASYRKALEDANQKTLFDRREELCIYSIRSKRVMASINLLTCYLRAIMPLSTTLGKSECLLCPV